MINKFKAVHALVGGELSQLSDGSFIYRNGQTPPSEAAIEAKLKELEDEYEKQAYARARAEAYPSWQTQMDLLYHGGLDALKAELKKTKDKFPKPK